MKKVLYLLLFGSVMNCKAQNYIPIPDTLSGTSIHLTMHSDSVQFLPGMKTFTNAFNQYSYLGPTLILNQGDAMTMNVDNTLTDTTTLHWHGLHVPAMADGGPHTVILSGTTWSPQFTVMNHASTFWYHPHLHMRTGEQAMRGAAGVIIVRDPEEAVLALPRTYGVDDFPLIVQSQQFDSLNQIMWRGMQDSILLVNGTTQPQLDVPAQVVRFRLLNAAQSRNFNFGFTANQSFYVIGNDGGLLSAPVPVTRIRLAPGERAEILVDLSTQVGQTLYLMSYASELGTGVQGGIPPASMASDWYSPLNGADFNILQLNVIVPTANPVLTVPSALVNVVPWTAGQADTTRNISFTAQSMMNLDGPFYFNGLSYDMNRIDYEIPLNRTEIWTLSNQTMVAHPFHIHDVQFFILDRSSLPPAPQEAGFKDVVLVSPFESVRFITKFEDFADPMMPYMYHCHILMHEDDGMMGQFVVVPSTNVESVSGSAYMNAYPNPLVNGSISIPVNKAFTTNPTFILSNLTGQEVMHGSLVGENGEYKISMSDLPAGTYVLKMIAGNQSTVSKIVKQ